MRAAETPEDVEAVRGLMRAYGQHLATNPLGAARICIGDFDREIAMLPGVYAPPGGLLLLALVDGAAAGCVGFKPIRPSTNLEPGERGCEMKRLWVGSGFRGLGLGRRLVGAGIGWGHAQGYTAMYLDTVPEAMRSANALYGSFGFKRVERYNDNPVADVAFFRLALGGRGSGD